MARAIEPAGEILGINLSSSPGPTDLSEESRFSYRFLEMPTVLESLLPDLRRYLPRRMARRIVERDLRARIPMIVDKHCGRLRYDFAQRLERSRLALKNAIDAALAPTIDGIRRAAERSGSELATGSAHFAERHETIAAERCELEAIKQLVDGTRDG